LKVPGSHLSEICINKTHSAMITTTSMKTSSKEVGNINISGRVKQIFVLIIAILIGMIISVTTADAKDYQRENHKKNKAVYKKQNNNMSNACHILAQKRNVSTNKVVKSGSKLKYR
jgi:hypothetical protein